MDSCQDELSPSDPIESVCQYLQPLTPGNLLLPVLLIIRLALISGSGGDRTQSASIRLRVRTIGLRSGVLDMCALGRLACSIDSNLVNTRVYVFVGSKF